MLKIIAAVAALLVGGLLVSATTRPDTFRVERSTVIAAPPEKVYALIDDFHAWGSWSPFEKLDPGMVKTHSGAARGEGAVYAWEGNWKAGAGRMEITDASPASRVTVKLDFTKPFEGHNTADFTLEARGDSTKVTWAMHGPNTYLGKVMQSFMDMDEMIGKDFETGLADMKAVAER